MELREYADILRKNWVLVVIVTILGLGAGAGASLLATPEYQSRTQLYVSVRSDGGTTGELVQGANYSRQIVNSYVAVVKTGVVLDPVVEELQLDMTGAELASYVSAASPADSALINITAISPSAEQSALIANAVGESFQEVVRTQLEPETENGASPVSLTTTQNALVPTSPISPNVMINLAVGLLVGLAVGYGIAILRTVLDRRIYSTQDIEQVTDKPVLGGIIDDPEVEKNRLIVHSQPHSPRAESFRALRTNLQFLNVGSKGRVFGITSPNPSESKSTTSLNLAFALAQTGSRVALVEGDLRLPSLSRYLEIEGAAGLTDVLIGRAEVDDVLQRWGQNEFYVLPAGRIPPNPSELLGSEEMEQLLRSLSERFDYVIVDAPPTLAVTDAAILGKMAAGLLMIIATGSTTKQDLEGALKALDTAGTNVFGVVATMVPAKKSGSYNYGYGAYGYGQSVTADPVETKPEVEKPRVFTEEELRSAHAK
ncbi:polysaccharide biosynthesis tyrosine autokinase [Corynebacterium sp. YIM 101645]|uniref:non-specific protein-tyrosine kinase n=1 Tax=Corynebacterium lemuris TaxID=1859292 RepID=A0ABT2G076_9CORY|nr:polysaccharide biosynthesis tyrosine autokinase [Corynebacterium lemuris]MCS5480806.1 polysaccharide biosynthesis tyrosine autokinase [Corynebacterium lemuris]